MHAGILGESAESRLRIISAWPSILLVSDAPDIVVKAVSGQPPAAFPALCAKACFLALLLGLCSTWKALRPLRPFAFVLLTFFTALTVSEGVKNSALWAGLITDPDPSFALAYVRPYLRDIGVTLAVLGALWIVKRRRSTFFLVKGRLDAPIEPVRWLGIRSGQSWRTSCTDRPPA